MSNFFFYVFSSQSQIREQRGKTRSIDKILRQFAVEGKFVCALCAASNSIPRSSGSLTVPLCRHESRFVTFGPAPSPLPSSSSPRCQGSPPMKLSLSHESDSLYCHDHRSTARINRSPPKFLISIWINTENSRLLLTLSSEDKLLRELFLLENIVLNPL